MFKYFWIVPVSIGLIYCLAEVCYMLRKVFRHEITFYKACDSVSFLVSFAICMGLMLFLTAFSFFDFLTYYDW